PDPARQALGLPVGLQLPRQRLAAPQQPLPAQAQLPLAHTHGSNPSRDRQGAVAQLRVTLPLAQVPPQPQLLPRALLPPPRAQARPRRPALVAAPQPLPRARLPPLRARAQPPPRLAQPLPPQPL